MNQKDISILNRKIASNEKILEGIDRKIENLVRQKKILERKIRNQRNSVQNLQTEETDEEVKL